MKHWKHLIVLLIVVLPLIAACGSSGAAPTPTPAVVSTPTTSLSGELIVDRAQLAKELNFYNWTEYIDPAILADFEAEYGVHVNLDLYESNEEMLAGVRGGTTPYDIAVPSDEVIKVMIAEGLLAPLNKSLLPNMQFLNPDLLDQYFDPGNVYSVPYFWGTTGIAYNQKYFDKPPDSWAVVFEPEQLEQIAGRFSMLEEPRELVETALLYQGKSISQFTEADLAVAEQLLRTQQPYLLTYTSSENSELLATEETILAHMWSGAAAQAIYGVDDKPGNPDIRYVIPQEGGVIWQDNLVILADSPHVYTAHVFINYLMRPDIAARNADWTLYLTPNLATYPILAEETLALYSSGLLPDAATMDRLQWADRDPATDQQILDLWSRIAP